MSAQDKKPLLSSKVMGLKFMQRAQEKRKRVEATDEAERVQNEAQWVVEDAQTRCIVIADRDPCPASLGRLSFNKMNPDMEKLQQEVEAREAQRAAAAAADPGAGDGKSISDEALAAELGKRRQQQQQLASPGVGGGQKQQAQAKQGGVAAPAGGGKAALQAAKRQKR